MLFMHFFQPLSAARFANIHGLFHTRIAAAIRGRFDTLIEALRLTHTKGSLYE